MECHYPPFRLSLVALLACWMALLLLPAAPADADNSLSNASQTELDSGSSTGQKLWCVAKPSASEAQLQANLDFACGEGGADCSALQPGFPCYDPDTLISHASYAMNMYYQRHGRNYWNCYFQNSGLVVFTDPSFGSCIYPPQ